MLPSIFLDSGAFSALTQKTQVNIHEYISFIKDNEDVLEIYANLDVIGNPEATWENQRKMEGEGLKPLPIIHYGTDIVWLQRYIRKGYDYIGLGGMVPVSTVKLHYWLDRLFSTVLSDTNGMPIIKVHGFGLTTFSLLLSFPWYSVDSTSWVITGRLGTIFVPRRIKGIWDYTKEPLRVSISTRNNGATKDRNFDTLSPKKKEMILMYLKEKGFAVGKSRFVKVSGKHELKPNERWANKKRGTVEVIEEPGVKNQHRMRDMCNAEYFLELEKTIQPWPWSYKKQQWGFGGISKL